MLLPTKLQNIKEFIKIFFPFAKFKIYKQILLKKATKYFNNITFMLLPKICKISNNLSKKKIICKNSKLFFLKKYKKKRFTVFVICKITIFQKRFHRVFYFRSMVPKLYSCKKVQSALPDKKCKRYAMHLKKVIF